MRNYPLSSALLERNRQVIPGGMFSINREIEPAIAFAKGVGAHLWDEEGNRYIDFHAAFGPFLLGHNHPAVNRAVEAALHDESSLFGAGTTRLEGRLAGLICDAVPFADSVQVLNSGSEATYQALRAARAYTGRDHIIVMQGGYNGWHNDVACNVMTPLGDVGERRSPGEYPVVPVGAGIPEAHRALIHVVNFNDLESVRYVCERYAVAGLITEPILQNIGIVKPLPGYLAGLRKLADEFGFVLIFDEVKTGFRHALGGFAAIAGVAPDLAVYGKALANGYPIAALAGRRELMNLFSHPDLKRRVLLAGTYNGHPVPVAAAIAVIELLRAGGVYEGLEALGKSVDEHFVKLAAPAGRPLRLVRQGSAFCIYFMDHAPVDWHDIAANHNFAADVDMRRAVIAKGIFPFPLPTKQWSISTAHDAGMIAEAFDAITEAISDSAALAAVR